MINVAMIGCGGYAYELLKRLWMLPEKFNVVAVSSRSGTGTEGGRACSEKGIKIYSDIDQMLSDLQGKADAIFVPTPIHTHKDLATKCMDAGFDVLLEKPPVATIQDLNYLSDYAAKKGKNVAVLFQSLYTKIIKELKDRIVSGEFGKVLKVRGIAGWPRMDDYYSRSSWAGKLKAGEHWVLDGTINNPLAHMLSNELYLASMEPGKMETPVSVTAELYHAHDIESEDTSSLRIITENGVEVTFNASLCSENNLDPINMIICEKATIEYINFNEAKITFNDGKTDSIVDETEQRVYMMEMLYDSMTNNKPFACTLDTCKPFTTCVNAAFESTGKVKAIEKKYITRREQGDTIKTVINGIDKALKVAYDGGKLFSELGLEWAESSETMDVKNYSKYPSA
ncbi:MAG: Gfo/Idh/MocA family protein [Sedimentisphaeraceae bacterium JB056]